MTGFLGAITIGIDPELHLGPVTLAWHGLTIAIGIGLGTLVAVRYARSRDLDADQVQTLVFLIVVAGVVGSRVLYLLQHDVGALFRPGDLIGTRGFSFYGALIASPAAAAVYLHRKQLSWRYLDALAAGFPLGMAVGRIGDLINGEHYGGATDLPWAVRYTHPEAVVPEVGIAYHSGGLYEIVLAVVMVAILTPLWHRLRAPTTLLWATILAYAVGRFVMFFARSDSGTTLGLKGAQWLSVAIALVSLAGLLRARRRVSSSQRSPAE